MSLHTDTRMYIKPVKRSIDHFVCLLLLPKASFG